MIKYTCNCEAEAREKMKEVYPWAFRVETFFVRSMAIGYAIYGRPSWRHATIEPRIEHAVEEVEFNFCPFCGKETKVVKDSPRDVLSQKAREKREH